MDYVTTGNTCKYLYAFQRLLSLTMVANSDDSFVNLFKNTCIPLQKIQIFQESINMKKVFPNKRRETIDAAKNKLKVCNTTFFAIKNALIND